MTYWQTLFVLSSLVKYFSYLSTGDGKSDEKKNVSNASSAFWEATMRSTTSQSNPSVVSTLFAWKDEVFIKHLTIVWFHSAEKTSDHSLLVAKFINLASIADCSPDPRDLKLDFSVGGTLETYYFSRRFTIQNGASCQRNIFEEKSFKVKSITLVKHNLWIDCWRVNFATYWNFKLEVEVFLFN